MASLTKPSPTQTNDDLADKVRAKIGGDRRKLVLFLGTGVSKSMTRRESKGHDLCGWVPFLRSLAEKLPEGCGERKVVCEVVGTISEPRNPEEGYPCSVILGLGHMIREKLIEEGTWSTCLQTIAEQIEQGYDADQPWSRFFEAMAVPTGKSGVEREPVDIPLILTTNYDSLVAKRLNAWVLTNPDPNEFHPKAGISGSTKVSTSPSGAAPARSQSAPPGFRLARPWNGAGADGGDEVPACLQSVLEAPMLWDMHRNGLLPKSDAFVHHVHGAAHAPETVVFDAADYERAIQATLWKPLASLLAQPDLAVVFAGVGQGMFDRHLLLMWRQLNKLVGGAQPPEPLAYWLRAEGERTEAEAQLEACRSEFPTGAIKLVTQEGFDWLPAWIDRILNGT